MTTSVFDPFVARLTLDWIMHYAQFLRKDPALVGKLSERKDEFELVPIPKGIMANLASGALETGRFGPHFGLPGLDLGTFEGVSGMIDPRSQAIYPIPEHTFSLPAPKQGAGPIQDREIVRSYKDLVELFRKFVREIETGRAEGTMKYISSRYLDLDGRRTDNIRKDLEKLISATKSRRLIGLHASDLQMVGNQISSTVHAAWEADIGNEYVSESVTLEMIFEKEDSDWKISSIRSV